MNLEVSPFDDRGMAAVVINLVESMGGSAVIDARQLEHDSRRKLLTVTTKETASGPVIILNVTEGRT